jgi:hypothetical protein
MRSGEVVELLPFAEPGLKVDIVGVGDDAYPGINAATLMTLRTPPDPRAKELVPVISYAVERKIASGKSDYWDFVTLLEVAVLAEDEHGAMDALAKALAVIRERWEPETTACNSSARRAKRARSRLRALSYLCNLPLAGGASRMMREYQDRICERLGVKFPRSTRQTRTSSGPHVRGLLR